VDRLSVDDLRCELRSIERGLQEPASNAEDAPAVTDPSDTIVCPNCGSRVSLPERQKAGGA
jgi:hypothetical protein